MKHTLQILVMRASAIVAIASIVMLSQIQAVQADIITAWDVSPLTGGAGLWGASPLAATQSDPNAAIVGLTRNWTPSPTGAAAAHAWGGNAFDITATTEAAAIASNDFANFSMTAADGYTLSLSDIPAYNIRRSATGPNTGIWQYKVDGGSFTDIGTPITWGSVTTSAGNAQSAISLSGISDLQNVAAGTTVTLRCVPWGATNVGGTWYINDPINTTANDFVVNGSLTAVPEPSTLALLIAGCFGLATFAYRHNK